MQKSLLTILVIFSGVAGVWGQGVTTAILSGKVTDQNGSLQGQMW